MSRETSVISDFAEVIAGKIVRRAIAWLQSYPAELSGHDSELRNVWDEICAQVQGEQSFFWDAHVDTIDQFLYPAMEELKPHELNALWLQTDSGADWSVEEGDGERQQDPPVCDTEVVDWLRSHHVLRIAGEWSNPSIRAFLERPHQD